MCACGSGGGGDGSGSMRAPAAKAAKQVQFRVEAASTTAVLAPLALLLALARCQDNKPSTAGERGSDIKCAALDVKRKAPLAVPEASTSENWGSTMFDTP